jgi:hypothetical protein
MAETSSRVPSRPASLSWHTHRESANQTLALDIWECQRGILMMMVVDSSGPPRPPRTNDGRSKAIPPGLSGD